MIGSSLSCLRSIRLQPLETIALGLLAVALLFIWTFPVAFYLPNGKSANFAINHYVIAAAIALAVGLLKGRHQASTSMLTKALGAFRNVLAFTAIVYLHFNFKLWAQLVNPLRFDDWYEKIDQLIALLIQAIAFINMGFEPLRTLMPHAYHDVFVYMFFATFIVFSLHAQAYRYCSELTTVIALILGLGGISYAIAPAWGPFIYSPSTEATAWEIQYDMGRFYRSFLASGGQTYSGQYFVAAIAAMPSLHSAHAFALWVYARRHIPWLGHLYLLPLIFILTEAVAAKWHYLIDLLIGILIAMLCMLLARKLHAPKSVNNPCHIST